MPAPGRALGAHLQRGCEQLRSLDIGSEDADHQTEVKQPFDTLQKLARGTCDSPPTKHKGHFTKKREAALRLESMGVSTGELGQAVGVGEGYTRAALPRL